MGILYIVATPIGNLEDITLRALRILREVVLIAAEDTRHTRHLLTHFDIHTPVTSYFEHNKLQKIEQIRAALERGDVALVSDAGTPTINDPGYELVRFAVEQGITVCPIPGPSSPIAALSAAGLPASTFLFMGYLPRKAKEIQKLLAGRRSEPAVMVFLESPNRVRDSLATIGEIFPDRRVVLGREITKKFEQFLRGSAAEVLKELPETPLGEMVLLIEGIENQAREPVTMQEAINQLVPFLDNGIRLKDAVGQVAENGNVNKKELYAAATKYFSER